MTARQTFAIPVIALLLSTSAAAGAADPAYDLVIRGGTLYDGSGKPPVTGNGIPRNALSFGILLNLASVANAETKDTLWGFVSRYLPEANPTSAPFLDKMIFPPAGLRTLAPVCVPVRQVV